MEQALTWFKQTFANPWLLALLVIGLTVIVAKLTDIVLCRALWSLAQRTKSDVDERLIEVLHRPIFLTVVLIGLFIAANVVGLDDPFLFYVAGLLKTLGVLIWTVALFRIIEIVVDGLGRVAGDTPMARTLPLFNNVAKLVVLGGVVYAILLTWQLDVKPWLASAGIAGLAIGFAAKDTIANLFGGLFILADAPYKLGDYIVLDSGERGQVINIGLRSTRILTRDDVEVTLPNAVIANAKIVNESGGPAVQSRVTVTVGVAYGSDVDQVRRVLMEAARAVADVVQDPEPRVRFTEFGDSALVFRLLCWIHEPEQRGRALDALNTEVYRRFNAAGIQIPFPQRDVNMRQPG